MSKREEGKNNNGSEKLAENGAERVAVNASKNASKNLKVNGSASPKENLAVESEAIIPVESQVNQWKRIGIYTGSDDWKISKNFLCYVWTREDKGLYIKNGEPIDATASNDDTVIYKGTEYKRVHFEPNDFNPEKHTSIGKTRPYVFIGNNYIFKAASDATKMSLPLIGCLKEVSASLWAISKGIPLAYTYGIFEDIGTKSYFEVEEKLDFDEASRFFCRCQTAFNKILAQVPIDDIDLIDIRKYLDIFDTFVGKLETLNIGGDFKIENLAFRKGNYGEIVATDLIIPSRENPYTPISYNDWATIAIAEGGTILIYTDPFSRINPRYYICPILKLNGGKRTRKNKNITKIKRKVRKTKRNN